MFSKNLSKRFKFKGFKIVLKGKRFYLYGQTNPWVLLASGDVKHIDQDVIKGKKLGDDIEIDGMQGVLIGKQDSPIKSALGKSIDNSGFTGGRSVRDTAAQTIEQNRSLFKRIQKTKLDNSLTKSAKQKKISGQIKSPSVSALAKLKSAIKKSIKERKKQGLNPKEIFPAKYEAHHIIPKEMEMFFGKAFDQLGINLDSAFNGMMLPPLKDFDEVIEFARKNLNPADIPANFWKRAKHQTHPDYNQYVKEKLIDIFDGFNDLSRSDKKAVKDRFMKFINS